MARPLPEDPALRAFVRMMGTRAVTRRRMLQLTGVGAGALTLAACSPSGVPIAQDTSASDPQVFWSNWTEYMDVDEATGAHPTLDAFTEATGIAVTYNEDVESNDIFIASKRDQLGVGQFPGFDLACLTDWMAGRLIRQGTLQQLVESAFPNKANLNPAYLDIAFDPGRKYSVPYQSGYAGLVYNKDEVPDGIATVDDLWSPDFKGKVHTLYEMRDTVGLVLMNNGVDIASDSWGDTEWDAALAVIEEQLGSGQIRVITDDYTDLYHNGEVWVGIAWSGDVTQMNYQAGYDKYGFVIPDAGGTLWSDNFLIPAGSPRATNATTLINWYYDPAIAAELAAWVNYITPVVGAQEAALEMEAADPESFAGLAENQLIFPDAETLAKVKVFKTLDATVEATYATEWSRLVGA